MKKILLILFLVIFTNSFSQNKLNGKFCNSFNTGYSSVCIDLKENNRFEYVEAGCLGVENFGKGEYFLTDKKLELRFDIDSIRFLSTIRIENWEFKDRKDSIEFIFKISEKNNPGEPLSAIILQESDSFQYEKSKQTNSEGRLSLTKPRNQKSEKYRVLFLGFERFEFSLENDHTKKVTIELAPETPNLISDRIFTFELSKITPDIFITEKGEKFKRVKQ
ncbi:MAG: hypothetical protein ABJ092_11875 [Gillisia sp.]